MAIPRVDPAPPQGLLKRAYMAFVRSRLGRWVGINIATRVDPWLLRVSNGRLTLPLVLPVALLKTRGARSGRERVNPVLYFSADDDVVIVASSFGRERHPAWYHNLTADPQVSLRVGAQEERFVARELQGAEREQLWAVACRLYPGYDDYRVRASNRQIPVLRLSRAT